VEEEGGGGEEKKKKGKAFIVACFRNIVSSGTLFLPLICNAY
jgi:hypothetical protein